MDNVAANISRTQSGIADKLNVWRTRDLDHEKYDDQARLMDFKIDTTTFMMTSRRYECALSYSESCEISRCGRGSLLCLYSLVDSHMRNLFDRILKTMIICAVKRKYSRNKNYMADKSADGQR